MRLMLIAAIVLGSSMRAADSQEQLNRLNVAVLDAQGQPVTGLTAADFQILDDGKPQPIVHFRFTGGKSAQEVLAPREYSNRSSPQRRTFSILFDMLNNRLLGDAIVRTELAGALKNLESSEDIYLYLLTPRGELFPVHPLPLPDTELKSETEPWTNQIGTILDEALKRFSGFHPNDELDINNRYRETVDALNILGGRMTEVSGRKTLVWVTQGFPLLGYSMSLRSPVDFTNLLHEFYRRLALSQIVVYPVDQSERGAGAALGTYSVQTLQEAADLTGGRRLTSDRVRDAITSALTDSRANYEIAYALPAGKPDMKRHKVRVTTARKDLRIQTLQAYYVLAPVSPEDRQYHAIEAAIHSPFDATDIGIGASIVPAADSKNLDLNILVDPADLLLTKSGDNHAGQIDLLIAAYDAKGFQQAFKPVSLALNLTSEQFEAASRGGLAIRQSVSVSESVQWFRIIVYDPSLNAVGSVRVPMRP